MVLRYKNRIMLQIKKAFTQILLKRGGKTKSERLLLNISKKLLLIHRLGSYHVLLDSIKNIRITVGLKTSRFRGSSYRIPIFFSKKLQTRFSLLRLCLESSRNQELLLDFIMKNLLYTNLGYGELFQERKKIFRIANQNKVFAHYR